MLIMSLLAKLSSHVCQFFCTNISMISVPTNPDEGSRPAVVSCQLLGRLDLAGIGVPCLNFMIEIHSASLFQRRIFSIVPSQTDIAPQAIN